MCGLRQRMRRSSSFLLQIEVALRLKQLESLDLFLDSARVLAFFYAILRDCTCLAELDATMCKPRWLLAVRLGFSVAAESVSPRTRHPRGEVKGIPRDSAVPPFSDDLFVRSRAATDGTAHRWTERTRA
jgi:hypothetical protein